MKKKFNQAGAPRRADLASRLLFAGVMLCALWAMTRCLDKPLLDAHAFRQTQTAMSTYYMVREPGMFAGYETPVLGKPWRIPMEWPLYQWITARWVNVSGMPLDAAGKLVSVAFWFACLWPLWTLLGGVGVRAGPRWVALAVIYASPLYLYWGRAFMIETTALFFCLGMVAMALTGCQRSSWWRLALALALGVIGALIKVTTWVVACGAGGLFVVAWLLGDWRARWRWALPGALVLALPLVPAKLWLAWADGVKALNPFARELLLASSAGQTAWNFGTWEQKLSPATWGAIGAHIQDQLLVPASWVGLVVAALLLGAGVVVRTTRGPVLICVAAFAAGPLIFTNIYFEHSYYWTANGVWLLLALGISLAAVPGIFKRRSLASLATVVATLMAAGGFIHWGQTKLPVLEQIPAPADLRREWTDVVQRVVPPSRTLLVLGYDWNPTLIYYAERRGIALPLRPSIPLPGPQLNEALTEFAPGEKPGAVLVSESLLGQASEGFWVENLRALDAKPNGQRTSFGILFPAEDQASKP